MIRKTGWKKDSPDPRDYVHAPPGAQITAPSVDLRALLPPVWDQGDSSSCTAHLAAALLGYVSRLGLDKSYSRLMIYYATREIEGDVDMDEGAEIRNSIKAVSRFGAPYEELWPFDLGNLFKKPSPEAYKGAGRLENYAKLYYRLPQTLNAMKASLRAGYPFGFGYTLFESFDTKQVEDTGVMPMPEKGEQVLGGHAVVAVGYDEAQKCFLIRNSWGKDWGMDGHFLMPYNYIANPSCCDDFWVIKTVGRS